MAVAALLAACGGGASSDANEKAGSYSLDVLQPSFPAKQQLGQTSLLKLGIHNSGDKTIPTAAVTFTVAGKEGAASALPFGVSNPQPGIAQPDRPVWVLAATYPRLAGSSEPGGASTSNPKTFSLGPLKPDETVRAVWKLSAVKAGRFTLDYTVAAGLSGTAKAKTASGAIPGGSFHATISTITPDVEVNDSGEVVEKAQQRERGKPGA